MTNGLHQQTALTGDKPAAAAREAQITSMASAKSVPKTRRRTYIAFGVLVVLGIAVFLTFKTFPNYDTFYSMIWGRELLSGHLPDYNVYITPTPHPLSTLIGAFGSLLGESGPRAMVLLTLTSYGVMMWAIFSFANTLFGRVIAIAATALILTRFNLESISLRGVMDVPFLALIFVAAALEAKKLRSGLSVLVLLGLAGLFRPDAWVLAGAYWLWLVTGRPNRKQLIIYTLLTGAAPLIWMAADVIVTGNPMYSLTSTREVAGELQRQRSLFEALELVPHYLGANAKLVNVIGGGLGALVALYLLRKRALYPIAIGGIGLFIFFAISAAGLSVIPRYLMIPSMLLIMCVGVALTGWTKIEKKGARLVAVGVAVLTVGLMAYNFFGYKYNAGNLYHQAVDNAAQHKQLYAMLDNPKIKPLVGHCQLITPTYAAIPIIRYRTQLSKHQISASTEFDKEPKTGLLLVGSSLHFEGGSARPLERQFIDSLKPWTNAPLPGFNLLAANDRWAAYANCPDQQTN